MTNSDSKGLGMIHVGLLLALNSSRVNIYWITSIGSNIKSAISET